MVEIKKYSIEELKILAELVEDTSTKIQLQQIYNVLLGKGKYITKTNRVELEDLGFVINTTYLSKDQNYIYNLRSGEMDIVNGEVLRIGLSRIDKFNPRWYEIKLNKKIR